MVEAVTSRSPTASVQLTSKAVLAVPSKGTVTVRGFWPSTVQLFSTPSSATSWSPSARPGKVTVPFDATDCDCVPSTVTV